MTLRRNGFILFPQKIIHFLILWLILIFHNTANSSDVKLLEGNDIRLSPVLLNTRLKNDHLGNESKIQFNEGQLIRQVTDSLPYRSLPVTSFCYKYNSEQKSPYHTIKLNPKILFDKSVFLPNSLSPYLLKNVLDFQAFLLPVYNQYLLQNGVAGLQVFNSSGNKREVIANNFRDKLANAYFTLPYNYLPTINKNYNNDKTNYNLGLPMFLNTNKPIKGVQNYLSNIYNWKTTADGNWGYVTYTDTNFNNLFASHVPVSLSPTNYVQNRAENHNSYERLYKSLITASLSQLENINYFLYNNKRSKNSFNSLYLSTLSPILTNIQYDGNNNYINSHKDFSTLFPYFNVNNFVYKNIKSTSVFSPNTLIPLNIKDISENKDLKALANLVCNLQLMSPNNNNLAYYLNNLANSNKNFNGFTNIDETILVETSTSINYIDNIRSKLADNNKFFYKNSLIPTISDSTTTKWSISDDLLKYFIAAFTYENMKYTLPPTEKSYLLQNNIADILSNRILSEKLDQTNSISTPYWYMKNIEELIKMNVNEISPKLLNSNIVNNQTPRTQVTMSISDIINNLKQKEVNTQRHYRLGDSELAIYDMLPWNSYIKNKIKELPISHTKSNTMYRRLKDDFAQLKSITELNKQNFKNSETNFVTVNPILLSQLKSNRNSIPVDNVIKHGENDLSTKSVGIPTDKNEISTTFNIKSTSEKYSYTTMNLTSHLYIQNTTLKKCGCNKSKNIKIKNQICSRKVTKLKKVPRNSTIVSSSVSTKVNRMNITTNKSCELSTESGKRSILGRIFFRKLSTSTIDNVTLSTNVIVTETNGMSTVSPDKVLSTNVTCYCDNNEEHLRLTNANTTNDFSNTTANTSLKSLVLKPLYKSHTSTTTSYSGRLNHESINHDEISSVILNKYINSTVYNVPSNNDLHELMKDIQSKWNTIGDSKMNRTRLNVINNTIVEQGTSPKCSLYDLLNLHELTVHNQSLNKENTRGQILEQNKILKEILQDIIHLKEIDVSSLRRAEPRQIRSFAKNRRSMVTKLLKSFCRRCNIDENLLVNESMLYNSKRYLSGGLNQSKSYQSGAKINIKKHNNSILLKNKKLCKHKGKELHFLINTTRKLHTSNNCNNYIKSKRITTLSQPHTVVDHYTKEQLKKIKGKRTIEHGVKSLNRKNPKMKKIFTSISKEFDCSPIPKRNNLYDRYKINKVCKNN